MPAPVARVGGWLPVLALALVILGVSVGTSLLRPAIASAAMSWHVPVLMYHHVLDPSRISPTERYPRLYVDAVKFDQQMAALKAGGWSTISTRQLADAIRTGQRLPARSIIITFDDGRPDGYTTAAPILEKYGFRGTFFVIPGFVGAGNRMTAQQLAALAAAGHEIANHTWTHPTLTGLSAAGTRAQIRRASDSIETITALRPVSLAYPSGKFDAMTEAAAKAEGIYLAFTEHYGAVETVATRLALPRIRVDGVDRQADGSFAGGTTAKRLLRTLDAYTAGAFPAAVASPSPSATPSPVPTPTSSAVDVASPSAPAPKLAATLLASSPPGSPAAPPATPSLDGIAIAVGGGILAVPFLLLLLLVTRRTRT